MHFLKTEAGAIVLWLVAALVTAALFTPHLYDAGKALAASAATTDYPSVIESIAASAQRAKLDRYFSRALLFSALALLPLLIFRVKKVAPTESTNRYALREMPWPQRLIHLGSGILIGATSLGILAFLLHLTDAANLNGADLSVGKIFSKALLPALGAGIIEEIIFRGLLLGLWLRACSIGTAWIGSSLMFSFVHFLKPPPGMAIADPGAWHSGFEIFASTLLHFTNPTFFLTEFLTLAFLGLLLAYCRTRTFSLWLPIGLHVGLVFALKTFSMSSALNPASPLHPWFIGSDLKSGILPLAALGICFLVCVFIIRLLTRNSRETIAHEYQ